MIEPCYALIGDLVASRREHERTLLAMQIEQVLQTVNKRYDTHWIAPIETTRGLDEVSSILETPKHAFDVVVAVNLMLWPAQFRFALAYGPIDVGSHGDRAGDFDGPAFHKASDALQRGRSEKRPLALDLQDPDPGIQHLAEATAQLHHAIMSGWTQRACEVVQMVRHAQAGDSGLTQKEIAHRLGVSQPAVSKLLGQAHHAELVTAETEIRAWLMQLGEEGKA